MSGVYSLNVDRYLCDNSKFYDEYIDQIGELKTFPMLNQLHLLTYRNIKEILELFKLSDLLVICVEIRKAVGHNFLAPDFVPGIYSNFEEISDLLVCDIASVTSRLRNANQQKSNDSHPELDCHPERSEGSPDKSAEGDPSLRSG